MKHLRSAAGFLSESIAAGFTLYQGYQIIQELHKKHRERKYNQWMNEFTTIEIRRNETSHYFEAAKSWFYTFEKVSQIMPANIVPSSSNRAITPLPVEPHPVCFENYEIYFHWAPETKEVTERIIISVRSRVRETVLKVMRAIFEHHENRKPHGTPYIYRNKKGGWSEEGRVKGDWNDIVIPPILPDNLYEQISREIRWFLSNRDWYRKRGIPYHRSYILEGLPGSGKTSLVRSLAQEHGLDLHLPNLKQTSESEFVSAIGALRIYDMLFMEDIDCAGKTTTRRVTVGEDEDKKEKEETFQPITLSAMLNCLDGVGTPDGLITFSTTNHIEKIDPAFLRPGRTDRIIKFTHATQEQIEKLCQRFEVPNGEIKQIAASWAEEKISMAAAQERLIERCLASLQIE